MWHDVDTHRRRGGVAMTTDALVRLRVWILGTLVLGLVGMAAELILLGHYEEPLQLAPLLLVAAALTTLTWSRAGNAAAGALAFRGTMWLFVIAGFVGVGLHFRGAAEFQFDMDPEIGVWDLTTKVLRAKDPPVLAPGVMLQIGLMGLAYAYSLDNSGRATRGTRQE
jgi:hypothetical protein